MRILGAAVITMESFLMGFALLLAMDNHGSIALSLGGLIAIGCLLTAGLMKKRLGWMIGSVLQVALIAYGTVVTPMYFMGALFAGLWATAFFLGRKGEAIRARLVAEQEAQSSQ
ncbi:MAG: hypothetical protein RL414_828 [Actinomycetota bacterium]